MFQRQGIGYSNPFQFANPFQQFSAGINPYSGATGFGGINPYVSQTGAFGVNPFGWQPPVIAGLTNPLYASQFGAGLNTAINPLLASGLPTVNPFLQSGIGTVNPLFAGGVTGVNPFLQSGLASVNPLLGGGLPVNPFLQTGIGSINPLLTGGIPGINPFQQTGIGTVNPTILGHGFASPTIGTEPGILSVHGQQLNPWGQQLPIRPLAGVNPFEQTVGLHGITGPTLDPYASLVQQQLLSQIANPLHQQMYRSFAGAPWATQGMQPVTGQTFPFAQAGVPFCI